MNPRATIAAVLLIIITALAVRSQLWTVAKPGDRPSPLTLLAGGARHPVTLGMTLPAIPFGSQQLASDGGVLLIHYWAPWERGSLEQVKSLDSLRQLPEFQNLRVVVVCFDPFPSVARYVARQRLRLSVLLDGHGELRSALPCPSVPYTYVLDRNGAVAIEQAGDVDWLAPATRASLSALLAERRAPAAPDRSAL